MTLPITYIGLTPKQISELVEALTIHLQGMDETLELMTQDTSTLSDLDTFTDVTQDHQISRNILQQVLRKVQNAKAS